MPKVSLCLLPQACNGRGRVSGLALSILRREWGALIGQGVVPGVAAALPYAWGMRWLGRYAQKRARSTRVVEAWRNAHRLLGVQAGGAEWFRRRYALYQLVDAADLALASSRRDSWLGRHVCLQGDPVPNVAHLALTLHLGAGLWGQRMLGLATGGSSWVHAPMVGSAGSGHRVASWLAHGRIRLVERLSCAPTIVTPGAYDQMEHAVAGGGSVNGLIDVPVQGARRTAVASVLGRGFVLPTGFLRFACANQVPLYLYTTTLSADGSARLFRGRFVGVPGSTDEAVRVVGEWISDELLRDPPAWHYWPDADHFFMAR